METTLVSLFEQFKKDVQAISPGIEVDVYMKQIPVEVISNHPDEDEDSQFNYHWVLKSGECMTPEQLDFNHSQLRWKIMRSKPVDGLILESVIIG
jgi:hypothetical protein